MAESRKGSIPDGDASRLPTRSSRRIKARARIKHELRLRTSALEAAANAIVITDRGGSIVWVNPAFTSVTGYSAAEVVGENPRILQSGMHDRAFYENIWATILSGKPWAGEMVNRRKDGSLYTEEMTITPVLSESGEINHFIAIKQDVSARKRAEAALADSQRRLQAIFDHSQDALLLADDDARYIDANAAACSLFGYEREEFRNLTLWDLTPLADLDLARQLWNDFRATGRQEGEYTCRRKDGTTVEVEYRAVAGVVPGVHLSVTRNITERKQAEESLRRSEERFRALTENSMDLISVLDHDGTVLYASPSHARILGYEPEELRDSNALDLIHPDDRDAVASLFAQRIDEMGSTGLVEVRFRHKDGSWRVIESVGRNLLDDPAVQGIVVNSRDVTDRKRAEEEARSLNTELEQRVAERTAALELANRELESFSYSVSHDLRAPLRGIEGFSKILLEDHAAALDAEGQMCLQRVRAATTRMNLLINDLLSLSRVTRSEMRRERIDLSEMARAILDDLRAGQPDREAEITIYDGQKANGDRALVRVALENLLGNAWKYTSKHERARIEFGSIERDDERAFFVRDNGVGFDPAYAHKLFGAFQRLHAESEFEGTGVGLATVARIVHRHGGRVWAEGAPDAGATFYFTLPEA